MQFIYNKLRRRRRKPKRQKGKKVKKRKEHLFRRCCIFIQGKGCPWAVWLLLLQLEHFFEKDGGVFDVFVALFDQAVLPEVVLAFRGGEVTAQQFAAIE